MKLYRIFFTLFIFFVAFTVTTEKAYAVYPLGTEVVFYDCEGTTGTTTNSGSGGSAYNGTFGGNGSTSPLVAKFGSRSCSFGETGDYLKSYFASSTDPTTSSISVSMWVYKKEASGGCTAEADHFFGSSGVPAGSRFYMRCNTGNHWGMRFGAAAAVDATTTVNHQAWEHIVLVFDSANDTPKMYVNNILRATSGVVSSFTIHGDFYLGMANDTVTTPGTLNTSEGANAYIDDIAFYSTALSASDITTLYNAGLSPGQVAGLVATAYEGKMFLSWSAASGTFTDYKVEYKLSSEPTTWTTFSDGVSTVASTTVTGLSNGSTYDFRITTLNNLVEATPSATVSATPNYKISFVSPTVTANSTTSSSVIAYASSTSITASSTHYISINTPAGAVVTQISTSTRYGDFNVRHLDAVLSNSDLSLLDNSSGISYVPTSNTIFLVHNRATGADSTIDEISLTGTLIRSITCTTCGDVEGIALMSTVASSTVGGYDYTFMLSTENDIANAEIYRVIIHSTGTTAVNKTDYFDTGITHSANGGLEGVAYNPTTGAIYVARELTTPALYEVILGPNHTTFTNQICANLTWNASISDFSDLTYNNGVLYVLSENTDPSKLVPVNITSTTTCAYVDSDEDGDVSNSDSGNWLNSLAVGVTDQAEGVTWDATGDYLYVLGEADYLAKYRTNRFTIRNTFTGVSDGSYVLKSSFLDSNGVTANAVDQAFGIDATGPSISAIASSTDTTTATVIWTTNESSDSKVSYGTVSGTYTISTTSSSLVTSHSLGLTGLSASTGYYYVVISKDVLNNISTSSEKTLITTATPDSTDPTVSLTAPTTGSTVSGASVVMTATASDNIALAGVSFKVDGVLIQTEDTTSTYGITWDSTSVVDGLHALVAVARDTSSNRATSTAVTVTVDNTAPVRSSGSPSTALSSNTTSTTLSLSTNETATCRYSTSAGTAYGSMTAFGTTNSTSHSTSISGLSNATSYTYYVKCSDAQGNVNATNYSISFSVAADVDGPVVSALSTGSLGNTSATIAWTTDEISSSLIQLGLTSSLGSTTLETNTSPRVISHSVLLTGLKACTTYYYKVRSKDTDLNIGLSSVDTFSTTGCTGSASIEDITASSVTTTSGGTVTLVSGSKGPTLTIPAAFSGANADFQIKKLENTNTIASTGSPTGLTLASDLIYDFKAYSDLSTLVSSFSQPITVTIAYTNNDISSLTESSLTIKRWDGSVWNDLSSCTLDTSANTVSCTTTQFSVFGLFGTENLAATPTTSRNSSSFLMRPKIVFIPIQNISISQQLTLSLSFGSWNSQVKLVQQILNMDIGTQVSTSGAGSVGRETTWYGPATRAAVAKFQLKYGIVKNDKDPGYGRVGPATRKKMNDLLNS